MMLGFKFQGVLRKEGFYFVVGLKDSIPVVQIFLHFGVYSAALADT
jgi:hypothetical protein